MADEIAFGLNQKRVPPLNLIDSIRIKFQNFLSQFHQSVEIKDSVTGLTFMFLFAFCVCLLKKK